MSRSVSNAARQCVRSAANSMGLPASRPATLGLAASGSEEEGAQAGSEAVTDRHAAAGVVGSQPCLEAFACAEQLLLNPHLRLRHRM